MLESHGGFLIYVARTYAFMKPYTCGIFLMLNSWQPGRDREGWKLMAKQLDWLDIEIREGFKEREDYLGQMGSAAPRAPELLELVPRLKADLKALSTLTVELEPPVRIICSSQILVALYSGSEASGSGFGGAIGTREGIHVRHGIWGRDAEGSSSNFWELCILVEYVEIALVKEELKGITGNSTAEAAFHNGTSSNKILDDLVVRMKTLEAREGMRVHFIHIVGTQMIEIRIDGLSRGSLVEGVMRDPTMLGSIQLHLGAFE
jgi:hypothetical protein